MRAWNNWAKGAAIAVGITLLSAAVSAFPVMVLDDRGQEITIPERPERIVVAGVPLYTETLLDIGGGDRIVGVASSPDNPLEVAGLPQVGPTYSPSVEAILALGPDLVLGAWGAARDQLEAAGVTVLTTRMIAGLPDIFDTIRTVGVAVGGGSEAERLIGRIAEEVVEIESKVFGLPPIRAAFLYMSASDTPPYAAGAGLIENELILRAGGANVFSDVSGFPQVSLEELVKRDPQVIFTDPAQVENIYRSKVLLGITAVEQKKVYGIKASAVTSTQVAEALAQMARCLHPEAFAEGDE